MIASVIRPARLWFTPRSTDREELFRERTIRIAVALLVVTLSVSLLATFFVYQSPTELISYPTVTVAMLVILVASGLAVAQQKIMLSGQLLVLGVMIGAFGGTMIDGFWGAIVMPSYMMMILITALVLPRSWILPTALFSVFVFQVIAIAQEASDRAIPQLDPQYETTAIGVGTNILFFSMTAAAMLWLLRREADQRLSAMSASIVEAEDARAEANRANEAKSQFLASMSHELRTPMNAIIGYIDLMLNGMLGSFTDQQNERLGHMRQNATRLLAMINDTLDLAKIEAGRIDLDISEMAPRLVIDETVGSMASLAERKGIVLKSDCQEDTPSRVTNDSAKFQQVLINLIGNAIKFTDEGSVTVVTGAQNENEWFIEVQDTGAGMPEDALPYIFEKFYQVTGNTKRGSEGTGLGLAITKRLVNYMGGTITVNSIIGEGSTFRMVFPTEVK